MKTRNLEPLGTFTALGVLKREWNKEGRGRNSLVEIPTPYGTFIFNRQKTTPEEAIERICRRLNVPAMSVANWLKDWGRVPLDSYYESREGRR